jgi:hypothetical protein
LFKNNQKKSRIMKKASVFLTLFLLLNFVTKAQFQLGIKGGVNLTSLKLDLSAVSSSIQQSYNSKTTYVAGVYMRIGGDFYVQPEVLMAFSKGNVNFTGSAQGVDLDYTNVDVPVLLGHRLLGILRINAGVVGSFNVSGGQTFQDAINSIKGAGTVSGALKGASWSYALGAGVDLGSFCLDVRYQQSISDVASASLSSGGTTNVFSQKPSAFQVTLGLKII